MNCANDEGVFHFENHESLEDEVFELHTPNQEGDIEADAIFSHRPEDIPGKEGGGVNESSILFSDRSPSHSK